MNTIHLEPNAVPAQLRNGYAGKRFKAMVCETMTIPSDADLWSGGSRDRYQAIKLSTGEQSAPVGFNLAPWDRGRGDIPVTLRPGFAIVRHSMFCGKDMGLTFYVHPVDAAALLPAPAAELSENERFVLNATASLKASYAGRDRYDNSNARARMTRAEWEAAKAALIGKALLNKAGAITIAGRNAR